MQDQLPPFDGHLARQAVEAELGRPVEEMFAAFDTDPLPRRPSRRFTAPNWATGGMSPSKFCALGSIRLRPRSRSGPLGGSKIESARPDLRRLKPVEAIDTIIQSVEIEMDLHFEAAAADELRENFSDEPRFSVPDVDWAHTGRRVTTEWIDAAPVNELDLEKLPPGDAEDIVANTARSFSCRSFETAFSMPIFIREICSSMMTASFTPSISALWDGWTNHRQSGEMLHGFLTGNIGGRCGAHTRRLRAKRSVDEFAQAARSIAEPILGLPLGEISLASAGPAFRHHGKVSDGSAAAAPVAAENDARRRGLGGGYV